MKHKRGAVRTTGICGRLPFSADFLLELLGFATSGGDPLLNVTLLLRHGPFRGELWFWRGIKRVSAELNGENSQAGRGLTEEVVGALEK